MVLKITIVLGIIRLSEHKKKLYTQILDRLVDEDQSGLCCVYDAFWSPGPGEYGNM